MKLIQVKEGVVTVGKKIVYQPLPKSIAFKDLHDAINTTYEEKNRPEGYYQDMIKSVITRVETVLLGAYAKSGFSKTSAYTKGAHTHFWKDPDQIYQEGEQTQVSSKRLLNCASQWYVNNNYDIEQVVKTKNELTKILSAYNNQ